MKHHAALIHPLIAQTAWAQNTIHVTPTTRPQADHKKTPNMSVTLTQALALLKAQTFKTSPRLPEWERNLGKRLVKAPKVFLPDSGLLAHLVELSPERLTIEAGLPGSLVETFVLGELLKHLAYSQKQLTLWHYRTQSNIEVDFILVPIPLQSSIL